MNKLGSHSDLACLDFDPPMPLVCDPRCELLTVVDLVDKGLPSRVSKYVVDDPCVRFDGISVNDVSLSAKVALGVEGVQAFCTPSRLVNADFQAYQAFRLSEFVSKQKTESKN